MSILTVLHHRVLAFKIFQIKDVTKDISHILKNHKSANF